MAKKITMNKHSGKTFEEVFAAFVTAKTAKGVSDVTIRNYHQNLHNISLHFDIQTPFDLLTKEMLDEMVVSMRKSGLAHNTIATTIPFRRWRRSASPKSESGSKHDWSKKEARGIQVSCFFLTSFYQLLMILL